MQRRQRPGRDMTVEFDSIPFDDLAIEIFGAKQAADNLASDRADHQQGDKGELMGHLENDQDGGNWRTNDSSQTSAHSSDCQSQLIALRKMEDRSADGAEEQSRCGPEKEGRRKYSPCASPGINCRGGGEFRDEQDKNMDSTHLAAKDQFKILVAETKNTQPGNPDEDNDPEYPVNPGTDDRLEINWNPFHVFDLVSPDQGALLKGDPGQGG